MTVDEILQALRERDATLYVESGRLRYAGPRRAPDDPLRTGIAEHREMLRELFTYVPGGRCVVAGCFRLKVAGANHCPDHSHAPDTMPEPVDAG